MKYHRVQGKRTLAPRSPAVRAPRQSLDRPLKTGLVLSAPLVSSLIVLLGGWTSRPVLSGLVLLLFGCAAIYYLRAVKLSMSRHQLGQLLFLLGFIGWYALPAVVDALDGQRAFGEGLPAIIAPDTVVTSVALLSLFLLSWALGLAFLARKDRTTPPKSRTPEEISRKRLYLFIAAAVVIGLLPYFSAGLRPAELIAAVGESRAIDKPWSFSENLGNRTSALLYIASSFLAAAACLLWAALLDKKLPILVRGLCAVIAVLLTLLVYFDQGTRSVTVLILLPTLLLLLVRLYHRSRTSFLLAVLVAGGVLFVLLQFQLLFRTNYTRSSVNDLILDEWATLGGTSDYFSETLFAVHLVPQYHDFFHESALLQFVLSPIPRFIWENKPATQVTWYFTLVRWGIDIYEESGNVFPGIVGQYWMSWGWLGAALIGFIMAWFTRLADTILDGADLERLPYRFLLGAMLATWILITYRFLSPGFLYPVLIAALGIRFARVKQAPVLVPPPASRRNMA